MAQHDPAKALEFIDRIPDGIDISHVVSSMGWSLSGSSVEQIEDYLAKISDPKAQNVLLENVIRTKASQGATDEAIELLSQIPEGDQRNNSLRSFTSTWASQDPVKTSEWLDALPRGADRDHAVSGFTSSIVRSDPEGALAWASSIGDEKMRSGSIQSTSRQWLRNDRDAAVPWIEATDLLTDKQKESILKTTPPNPDSVLHFDSTTEIRVSP